MKYRKKPVVIEAHKRGTAFIWGGVIQAMQDGVPVTTLPPHAVRSQVRTYPALVHVADLTVILGTHGAEGIPVVLKCADTRDWPVECLCLDVRFELPGGHVGSTETVIFSVEPGVTQ